jgi:ATP-dependent RNA helicase DDX55/SPB4
VSFFVHRVGRTARAGRDGSAVCLLLENEHEAYIAFLKQRGVELASLPTTGEVADSSPVNGMVEKIRSSLTAVDREYLNKASAAFVSFVRAYQEHQLRYIFNLKELSLGDVALSFSCLQVPRVKEILGKKIEGWVPSEVKSESVPFLDKAKEAKRQELLNKKAADKAEAEAEVSKNKTKRQVAEQNQMKEETHQRTRSEKREAKRKAVEDEWLELQEEERMAKKLKKGKISKKDFDKWLLKKRDDDSDFDGFSDEIDGDSDSCSD